MNSFELKRALFAGFVATLAMTFLMYGWPLVGLPRMDVMAALGGVFPFGVSPYIVGGLIHFGIGISLAVIYALFFNSWLPGHGWLRGALFSLAPWVFAITLMGPTLQMASEFFAGGKAAVANPCAVSNPCAVRPSNPCAVDQPKGNPCAANPCAVKSNPCSPAVSNPCGASANPCAVANPCGAGPGSSSSGISPEAMSLLAHLFYGLVLGIAYRPSA